MDFYFKKMLISWKNPGQCTVFTSLVIIELPANLQVLVLGCLKNRQMFKNLAVIESVSSQSGITHVSYGCRKKNLASLHCIQEIVDENYIDGLNPSETKRYSS